MRNQYIKKKTYDVKQRNMIQNQIQFKEICYEQN